MKLNGWLVVVMSCTRTSVASWLLTGPNSWEYASPRGHPWGWGLTVPDPVSGKDPMPLCWSSPDTLRKAIFVEWALCKRAVSDFGPFREPPEGECPWKRWGKQCAEPL